MEGDDDWAGPATQLLLGYDALAVPSRNSAPFPVSFEGGGAYFGGTADPDGYYEDFASHLGRLEALREGGRLPAMLKVVSLDYESSDSEDDAAAGDAGDAAADEPPKTGGAEAVVKPLEAFIVQRGGGADASPGILAFLR